MDIDYLLLVQNFRENILGGSLNTLGEEISKFAVGPWFFIIFAIIYWNFNKHYGMFFFMTLSLSRYIGDSSKLFACCYRPWVREPKIVPAGDAITSASGYSFPSGHSIWATSEYGTIAIWASRAKKYWLTVISVILCLLTMFSRNFLGVHTPQDVIVGCAVGIAVLFFTSKFLPKLEKTEKKTDIIVLVSCIAFVAILLTIIAFKPYPMDYVDGKLLADPAKLMKDGFGSAGMFVSMVIGWFVEKHFIKFSCFKNKKIGFVIAVLLAIPIYFLHEYGINQIFAFIPGMACPFIANFVTFFYMLIIVPVVVKAINKKMK